MQALTIFEKYNIRYSYGKTICILCRKSLATYSDVEHIQRHQRAFEWINVGVANVDESSDDQLDDDYKDPVFCSSPNSNSQSITNINEKKRELLNEYLSLCGSHKKIKTTNSYHNLQKQSKANFLASVRTLIHHIFDFLAPNESSDVQQALFRNKNGNGNRICNFIIQFLYYRIR